MGSLIGFLLMLYGLIGSVLGIMWLCNNVSPWFGLLGPIAFVVCFGGGILVGDLIDGA